MDSDTLSIVLFIAVTLVVLAAGVYVVRPEKKRKDPWGRLVAATSCFQKALLRDANGGSRAGRACASAVLARGPKANTRRSFA